MTTVAPANGVRPPADPKPKARHRNGGARPHPSPSGDDAQLRPGSAAPGRGALSALARRAGKLGTRGARLGYEAALITAGRSAVKPAGGDGRFRDPAWSHNPAYHRLMQSYLAWSDAVLGWVDDAELDWRDAERARFVLQILVSAAAPTNSLLGNPAALKQAFQTGGISLVRGSRNLLHDLRTNRGMPSQVPAGAFAVGRNLAVTPGAVVYRDEVCEVLQYAASTPEVRRRPAIMVPPQIGRYYFMDLAPGRSFVEYAVSRGLSFFLISWRNPGPEQASWDFDAYAAAVLRAVDVAREITRSDEVNLLSLCAGGILSAGVLSHLADRADEALVRSASFGVTLLDFDIPAPIGAFGLAPLLAVAAERSARPGVLAAKDLAPVFTWMRPDDLVWRYWVNNYLLGEDPPAFDILAWNADGTNLPAALHRQFLEIFRRNVLVTGELEVLGTPVKLSRIATETYVTGATADHLTPWKGCYRTAQLLSGPSTFILSNAGHIASLVNPPGNPKARYYTGPEPGGEPEEWLAAATERTGTWWEHWTEWVTDRSGEEVPAPARLGSRKHRPIEPAPGIYVTS
ncbi:MAG: alpha/beta fold hydrolase [Solirubrobacterales bacterium]|nr:alpha/beta fold hydrolase [Solirubrobacterales bacterium]